MGPRSIRNRVVAIVSTLAIAVAGIAFLPAAPAPAACPTLAQGDTRWISAYTIGASGSNWAEVLTHYTGGSTATAEVLTLNGSPANTNHADITITCNSYHGFLYGISGVIEFSATIAANGNEVFGGQWGNGVIGGQFSSARVVNTSTVDDDLTTDSGTGATPSEPTQVSIVSPSVGTLSIDRGTASLPVVAGYQLLNQVVHITAPAATPGDPLVFTFVLDSTVVAGVPLAQLEVFRNGQLVGDCSAGAGTTATPDPCVEPRTLLAGGDVRVTVRTSAASSWTFGASTNLFGLRILNAGLTPAKLGQPYSATLFASGGTEPYKFKKLDKLPKGLKLKAKTGVISGTPKKVTGIFPLRVLVIDKAKPKRSASKIFFITVS
jgi:hypothetical protein